VKDSRFSPSGISLGLGVAKLLSRLELEHVRAFDDLVNPVGIPLQSLSALWGVFGPVVGGSHCVALLVRQAHFDHFKNDAAIVGQGAKRRSNFHESSEQHPR